MSDDFHKFMFLGAMIVLAIFSNRGSLYPRTQNLGEGVYGQRAAVADVKSSPQRSPTPTFVLNSPSDEGINKSSSGSVLISGGDFISSNAVPSSSTPNLGEQQAVVSDNSSANTSGEQKLIPFLQSPVSNSSLNFTKVGNDDPPKITAAAMLVADLASGDEYFSAGKEKRWPIASITKLMTAAIVSREIAFNQSTTMASADFTIDSSGKSIKIGDRYSVSDLMLAMLMESSNEAAEALASVHGRDNFISGMNQQADAWGISGTHFDDPTGLSPSDQSSILDLEKLALNVFHQYPEIFKITRRRSASITELNSGKKFTVKNINLFTSRPDFLGGKTGYIEEASGNLLSLFSYKRRSVIIIVLGSDDRFHDSEKLLNWFEKNYK